jgi:hypothetical protein
MRTFPTVHCSQTPKNWEHFSHSSILQSFGTHLPWASSLYCEAHQLQIPRLLILEQSSQKGSAHDVSHFPFDNSFFLHFRHLSGSHCKQSENLFEHLSQFFPANPFEVRILSLSAKQLIHPTSSTHSAHISPHLRHHWLMVSWYQILQTLSVGLTREVYWVLVLRISQSSTHILRIGSK